jgi:hypothetical protein
MISAALLFSSQLALAQSQFTQRGPKLVGTGAVGLAEQGYSVSISGDGNTAIVGGLSDNSSTGAAWVYTRSNGVWAQQAKLVGTVTLAGAQQGQSVGLSADWRAINAQALVTGRIARQSDGRLSDSPLRGGLTATSSCSTHSAPSKATLAGHGLRLRKATQREMRGSSLIYTQDKRTEQFRSVKT